MEINKRIEADTILIAELNLCQLRLLPDELDWFVLVPKRKNITEIHQLDPADQGLLIKEISFVSRALENYGSSESLNIGALGNIVSQLHIHIIGRRTSDRAWPGAIWGTKSTEKFDEKRIQMWISCFKNPNSM